MTRGRGHASQPAVAGGLWPIAFVAPALVLIVVFFLYPFAIVVQHAFTEWDGIEPARFNGLDNFRELLDDPTLVTAIRNNVLFALAVPIQVLVSLVIAVLVYQRTPGWRFFRAIFFLPVIMSPVVIGLIWSAVFALDGPINALLDTIGADGQERDWLGDPKTSIPAIMIVVLWATFGFNMMLYLAGLSALPPMLLDAARVDGASWWQSVRHVIVPSLRRVTQLVVVINLITAFAFMVPYIFVMTGGGPGTDTYVTEYLIYNEGFTYGHLGYASAISLSLFAVVSLLMLAYVRVLSPAGDVKPGRIAVSVALGAIALLSLLPLYFVVVTAFKSETAYADSLFAPPAHPVLENFSTAWQAANIATYMRNSVVVSLSAVVISTVVATALAFAIVYLRWPGRSAVYTLCLILLAVPPLLLLIPVFDELARLDLIDTRRGIVLLYAALTAPFSVFLLVTYMRSIPWAMVEAASLDGASVPALFLRIVVPLSLPAVGTACIFSFLFCWNEFIYSVVLLQSDDVRTLPAGLASLQGKFFTDFPVLMAAVTVGVLPVIALYAFLQRYLVRGIAVGVD